MAEKPCIYNIYPVFSKVLEDMKTNTFLDESFKLYSSLKNSPPATNYTRLKRCLKPFIEKTYDLCCNNGTVPEFFEKYKDCTIELVKYGKYKLIFLKLNNTLIFMNYVNADEILEHSTETLLPWNIPNSEILYHQMVSQGKTYTVVNTYDAFTEYIKYYCFENNISDYTKHMKIEMNRPFFNDFERSAGLVNFEAGNSFQIYNIDPERSFRYCVYKDLIVITEFKDQFMDNISRLSNSNNDDFYFEY